MALQTEFAEGSTADMLFPVLLSWRNKGHMLDISRVPDSAKVYYQLLPAAHGRKQIEEQVELSSDEYLVCDLEHKLDIAETLAGLPGQPWWDDLACLVTQQPQDPADHHQAEQWLRLVYLMHHRAEDFGAGRHETVDALANVLTVNKWREPEPWPSCMQHRYVVPRLDRTIHRLISARPDDEWVTEGQNATHCILHPLLREVGYSSISRSALPANQPDVTNVTAQLVTQEQTPPPEPLALRRGRRNKPGKAERHRRRVAAAFAAGGLAETGLALTGPSQATQSGKSLNGPPSDSSSQSHSSVSSSSSDSGSDDNAPTGNGSPPPVSSALPAGEEQQLCILPLNSKVAFPALQSTTNSAPQDNSFTFPAMPIRSFASLFGGTSLPEPVSVRMHAVQPPASLPMFPPSLPAARSLPESASVPLSSSFAAVNTEQARQPDRVDNTLTPSTVVNIPAPQAAPVQTPAQISISETSSDDAGADAQAKGLAKDLTADPEALRVVCQWLNGPQTRQTKPASLKNLSDNVLDALQNQLSGWMSHFASVSPPSQVLVANVPQGNEQQPAVQQSVSVQQQPASVQVPAATIQPALAAQAQADPQVAQALVRGSSRIRLPPLQHFSGDANSAKPKVILGWLRQMQLALQQDPSMDPVSIAVMHLDGNAASWRDTTFLPAHAGIISWQTFETALKSRFMDRVACMDALREFRTLSQRTKQSVQDFNDLFVQRRLELGQLPYVSVPDEDAQVNTYLSGLRQDIAGPTQEYADVQQLHSLSYWMQRAVQIEAVHETRKMREPQHATKQKEPAAQGVKKRAAASTASTPSRTDNSSGQGSKKHKGKQKGSQASLPSCPQYPENQQLRGKVFSSSEEKDLQSRAKLSITDSAGNKYPNMEYRLLKRRQCEAEGLCFFCFQSSKAADAHPLGECPSPAFDKSKYKKKVSSQATVNVSTVQPEPVPAGTGQGIDETTGLPQDPDPDQDNEATPSHVHLAASVQAQPHVCDTMLFVGADLQGQKVNILLDTGSSHNVCSSRVNKNGPATGRKFSVACAGQAHTVHAPEHNYSLSVQGTSTVFPACEMDLPSGIDILLGQAWLASHQATLLTWTGQVNFLDDQGQPAIWVRQKKLQDNLFNEKVKRMETSVKGKQGFIAFVRTSAHRADAVHNLQPASAFVASADLASVSQANTSAAATGPRASRLQDVFVEQQSTVAGIQELVQQFSSVFPEDMPAGLPPDRGISHAIPMQTDSVPPAQKPYRLSKPQREEMEKQITSLLAKGWIRPSSSPYGSPILFAKKKDGGMRMCVDYRAVNKLTLRNSYPIPRIDDLVDRLVGATTFSCLDLQQAYHQVRLNSADIPKTAFTTPQGLYEYMVLPFGLSNAPSTFQSIINGILGPELRHCCLVYMDDIMVYSKSPEEHLTHLRQVLCKLQGAQLYARLHKCRFALSSVKFCGHVIDKNGIMPDPDKVKVVLDWPTPLDVHQLRSFVGLAQYFRKFIQAFACMIAPLTALFKKGAEFKWSVTCQQAFQQVKEALTTVPCLKLPHPDEPYTMITDASGIGIGAVLLQGGRPVAFEGRALTPPEKKWSATEQEMLGVVYHMEKWRCYLDGMHFTVVTDHQPNTWFASQKQLSPRQARWYERLRGFDFTWEYRPGRLNVADPLSRNPAYCNVILASCLDEMSAAHCFLTSMGLRSQGPPASIPVQVSSQRKRNRDMQSMLDQAHSLRWGKDKQAAAVQPTVQEGSTPPVSKASAARRRRKLRRLASKSSPIMPAQLPALPQEHVQTDNPDTDMPSAEHQHSAHADPAAAYAPNTDSAAEHLSGQTQTSDQSCQGTQSTADDGRRVRHKSAADDSMQTMPGVTADTHAHTDNTIAQPQLLYGGDAPIQTPLTDPLQMLEAIKGAYKADPLYSAVAAESRRLKLGIIAQGALFRRGAAICVPDAAELRTSIMRELHCSPYAGHTGMNRTLVLISRFFYWPDMRTDINDYVRGCVVCQRNKSASGKPAGKLQPLPVPSGIWEDISMDFIGPLPKTARGHDFVLNVVDRLSKMAHFLPCKKSIDGRGVAELYASRIWSLHGQPRSIVTDRGTQFVNAFNKHLLSLLGTRHAVTSAYHPETDGQTERVNRVLSEMLRHYTNARYDDWDLHLPMCEFAHNNARSSATGMSPFYVCFGKHPLTPMSAVIDAANAAWLEDPHDHKDFLSADKFVADKRSIVRLAQEAMEHARSRMVQQEDGKRSELTFSVGDQVSLRTKHLGINTLPSKKLFPLWMGPFTVSKVVNPAAYKIELPTHWKAHNVFHVSLLKPYISNGEAVDPQSYTLIGGKEHEYEIEQIVDFTPKTAHRSGKLRKVNELIYWVKWRGQAYGLDVKQPLQNLRNSPEALTELALRFKLPADTFDKGSNRLPVIDQQDAT